MNALESACKATLEAHRKERRWLRLKWTGIGILIATCVVYAAERWL